MRKFLIAVLILLAACAPTPPLVSNSQTSPPIPAKPSPPTVLPGQANLTQPANGEAVTTQTPLDASSGALWLRILSPQDGETVNTPTIKIKGQAPAETVITVNDQIYVVPAEQAFEAEVGLESGPNLIEIVASDLDGNEVYIPLTVEYEP